MNPLETERRRGEGVEKNMTEAAKFYRMAASQDHIGAQFSLGCCLKVSSPVNTMLAFPSLCQYGVGVPKDLSEAVRLFQLAANRGCANSQNNLAHCYQVSSQSLQSACEKLTTL